MPASTRNPTAQRGSAQIGLWLALGLGLGSPATRAQQEAERVLKLEEVVVTARRREENLQSVPVSATTFDGATVNSLSIDDAYDLTLAVPGLNTFGTMSNKTAVNYTIRAQRGDTSTVAVYFDEVYARESIGTNIVPYDLSSVEVLKGPQGTLFGANATGGAIIYRYETPQLGELGGEVRASLGNHEFYELAGALNLPAGESNAFRVSGLLRQRDGYTKILSGGNSDGEDRYAFRAQWLFKPSDVFDNRLLFEKLHWNEDGNGGVLSDVVPGGLASRLFPTLAQELAEQESRGPRDVNYNLRPLLEEDDYLVENVTNVKLPHGLRVKNIFGYRDVDSISTSEDGTPFTVVEHVGKGQTAASRTLSNELQLFLERERFDAVLGLYWDELDFGRDDSLSRPSLSFGQLLGTPFGSTALDVVEGEAKTQAIYGHVEFRVTDRISIAGGYRYNDFEEDRQATGFNLGASTTSCRVGVTPECTRQLSYSDSGDAWNLNLSYTFDAGTMAYLTHRHGYRRGGINQAVNLPPDLQEYRPEDVDDYELGIKSAFALGNVPMRLNAAAYFQDYQDIQRAIRVVVGTTLTLANVNAAEAEVKGAEIEWTVAPFDGLMLTVGYSYTDAEFTDFNTALTGDLSNSRFAHVPKSQYSLIASYETPRAFDNLGHVSVQSIYGHRSSVWGNDQNEPLSKVRSYGLWNLRAGVDQLFGQPLGVAVFVDNVTDKEAEQFNQVLQSSLGIGYAYYTPPRMYGMELSYSF